MSITLFDVDLDTRSRLLDDPATCRLLRRLARDVRVTRANSILTVSFFTPHTMLSFMRRSRPTTMRFMNERDCTAIAGVHSIGVVFFDTPLRDCLCLAIDATPTVPLKVVARGRDAIFAFPSAEDRSSFLTQLNTFSLSTSVSFSKACKDVLDGNVRIFQRIVSTLSPGNLITTDFEYYKCIALLLPHLSEHPLSVVLGVLLPHITGKGDLCLAIAVGEESSDKLAQVRLKTATISPSDGTMEKVKPARNILEGYPKEFVGYAAQLLRRTVARSQVSLPTTTRPHPTVDVPLLDRIVPDVLAAGAAPAVFVPSMKGTLEPLCLSQEIDDVFRVMQQEE